MMKQQKKDKKELAALPKGVNKPISWCSQHDCKLATCFPIHYPESVSESDDGCDTPDEKIKDLEDRFKLQSVLSIQLEERVEELELALEEAKTVAMYWQRQYAHIETEMANLDQKEE